MRAGGRLAGWWTPLWTRVLTDRAARGQKRQPVSAGAAARRRDQSAGRGQASLTLVADKHSYVYNCGGRSEQSSEQRMVVAGMRHAAACAVTGLQAADKHSQSRTGTGATVVYDCEHECVPPPPEPRAFCRPRTSTVTTVVGVQNNVRL